MPQQTHDQMTIQQMQDAIRAQGYQWREEVYNDGNPHDCYVQLSQSTDPKALSGFYTNTTANRVGWGRFERLTCWRMAYGYIVLHRMIGEV